MHFSLLIVCICTIANHGVSSSGIAVSVNPGCEPDKIDCLNPWLISVHNTPGGNANATEYYHLWGGVGSPTVIAAQTSAGTTLSVDWEKLIAHSAESVVFTPAPLNVFGLAITEVILYDDPDDKGSIASIPLDEQLTLPATLFHWDYTVHSTNGSVQATIKTISFNGTKMENDTGIVLKLSNTAVEHRESERPRLLATAATTTMDLVLDHLFLNVDNPHPSPGSARSFNHHRVEPMSGFTSPRFAVRLVLFSNEKRQEQGLEHTAERSIDDEYAPGIFELDVITTPHGRSSSSQPEGGFLQWRPVCYLTPEREVNKATLPNLSMPNNSTGNTTNASSNQVSSSWFSSTTGFLSGLEGNPQSDLSPLDSVSEPLRQSLAYAVLGDSLTLLTAAETIVSFGEEEDGYYTSYNYTVWTMVLGSGSPPSEGLSTEVLIVILCGLGLPLVAIILSGIGLVVWKLRNKRRQDQQRASLLQEEEEE